MTPVPILNAADKRALTDVLATLARHYGYVPRLEYRTVRAGRSDAWWGPRWGAHGTIRIASRNWRGGVADLVHEYAHIILFHRVGKHGHDRRFFTTLVEAIKIAGVTDYSWHTEYKTLYDYAVKAGLTTTPYFKIARNTPPPGTPKLVPGTLVTWTSPKRGRMTGTVVSARTGARAKVQVDLAVWMVPQQWLAVVPSLATPVAA